MSHDMDKPVHNQMEFATMKGPFHGDNSMNKNLERKPSGKRRVFVQTETGFVLGIDLDRNDNAHTVKRKLQVALHVPTEERSLMCGDMVLKNDLSVVRNDSPLLLTRNYLHRSSSSPCLSPIGKDLQQRDQNGPIEILGLSNQYARTRELVMDIMKAIKNGIDPIPVRSGLGGAYFFRNCQGENIAIVKPTDEEPYAPNNPKGFIGNALGRPGLKRSVRVGETGFREVAAYLLDHDGFANVPSTALVMVTHPIFNINDGVKGNMHKSGKHVSKIASMQQFVPHDFDASDHGPSSFPVAAVHRIGILDIRILNTDRHAGNLLVRKFGAVESYGKVELIPIDHGFCLPESLEDPYFEWVHWPQASIPFSEEELEYIDNLNPFRDSEMLKMELPMIHEACLRVFVVCTILLKEAAAFGLCLAEIGEMMSREFRCHEDEPSEFELICMEARKRLEEEMCNFEANVADKEEFQFDIDYEEEHLNLTSNMEQNSGNEIALHFRERGGNGTNLLFKVDEETEEEKEVNKATLNADEYGGIGETRVSKLSMSMKNITFGKTSRQREGGMQKSRYLVGISSGNKIVNEHLPSSSSFVKLGDMNGEEWMRFLDNFQRLLYPAFYNRKAVCLGQGQRQRLRLGTSCQF